MQIPIQIQNRWLQRRIRSGDLTQKGALESVFVKLKRVMNEILLAIEIEKYMRNICLLGSELIGETAKEAMDTILRLDMVSMLEHASYLSIELTNAELALRLNRGYEQDEELF